MRNEQNKETLLTNETIVEEVRGEVREEEVQNNKLTKKKKKNLIIVGGVFVVIVVLMVIIITQISQDDSQPIPDGAPRTIRIAMPNNTAIELGNSRVLEVLYFSNLDQNNGESDNRNSEHYKAVTKRDLTWSVSNQTVISVDMYGRVEALSLGNASIWVESESYPKANDVSMIYVVEKATINPFGREKRVVNYEGVPVKPRSKPQKIVTRLNKTESLMSDEIPESIKKVIDNPQHAKKKSVIEMNDIRWQIMKYANGSNLSYLLRTDITLPQSDRDKLQYFIGDRYLPGAGTEVISLERANGERESILAVNSKGEVTRIDFVPMNGTEKAVKMVRDYQPHLRYGMASGCYKSGNKWIPDIDDNDGLWTSMYGVGELMRYSSMKELGFSKENISQARSSALKSLKAVLMISNVPSRNKIIDARIRHLNNSRAFDGAHMSAHFLKDNCQFSIDNYAGNSEDGVGFYGSDAGKTIDDLSYGGKETYTYLPFEPSSWSTNATADKPATTKRTLKGFIARSFGIENLDNIPGGLFFKHNGDGTQTVISDAHRLYDFDRDSHPTLDLGNLPLPPILQDVIKVDGIQYNKSNLIYKGDTSSDELIGHLFIYKVAFDILDQADPQEKQLKGLIVSTMTNFCTGLVDNGYAFVDATGQGTTWGKLIRDFLNSDFTIEDAPVHSIVLLMSFKVCAYVTGDEKWEKEYRYLIEDSAFRYLDVVAGVWRRWVWRSFNEDYNSDPQFKKLNNSENYTDEEVIRHVMMEIHYSDEEQVLLGYYLAFQLQENQTLLSKFREGLQGWWHSVSRSENPIWYFIYQLAYPNKSVEDHFGSNVLDVSAWQLDRHPLDTITYTAFIEGSRSDVLSEGIHPVLSIDPTKIIQKRKHTIDSGYLERPINRKTVPSYDPTNLYEIKVLPKDERRLDKFNGATFEDIFDGSANNMQTPTTYTLPYWFGVYHKMIDIR